MRAKNYVLRKLRTAMGLSQRKMAGEVGISPIFLSQVENGSESLGHQSGLKIVARYRNQMAEQGITLEDLLRGKRTRRRGRAA